MTNEKNWIDQIIDECEDVETPRAWLFWSLICAISASAGNNYVLKVLNGKVTYKANIYAILLGESGLGKGFGINLSKKLVDLANVTRVITGTSSIQGIIEEIATATTRENKAPISDSRCFLTAGELSTSLITDQLALTSLTDLYDGMWNEKWGKLLKNEKTRLKDPYVTWLAGSSPAHFYDSIPQVNIDGGLIGRTLISYEERRYKDSDLLTDDAEIDIRDFPFERYIVHLERVNNHSGRFIPSPDARELFNRWRKKWRESQSEDKTGFINRVPDHVLKVSMCLRLAEQELDGLLITTDHIELAIERVTALVYSHKRAIEGKGEDPTAPQAKMILDFLLSAPGYTLRRKQLLNKGYGHYGTVVLDAIIDQLMEIGWIKRERLTAGINSDWILTLVGEPREQYERFTKSKERKLGT